MSEFVVANDCVRKERNPVDHSFLSGFEYVVMFGYLFFFHIETDKNGLLVSKSRENAAFLNMVNFYHFYYVTRLEIYPRVTM